LMMMPVLFGFGGYVLVNRRPWARRDDGSPGAPNGVSLWDAHSPHVETL